MRLEGSLQPADHNAFQTLANKRLWPAERQIAYLVAVLVLVASTTGFLALTEPNTDSIIVAFATFFGWAMFHCVQRISFRLRPPQTLGDLRGNQESVSFDVSASGLSIRSQDSSSTQSWRVFTDVEQEAGTVVLFTAPGVGIIVPRNSFSSVDHRRESVSTVQGYMEASATSPPTPEHP